jgi:hypothetical protein
MRRLLIALMVFVAGCAPQAAPAGPSEFERWLSADAWRAPAFARFEAMLEREGVADVVPPRELWLTDRLAPQCVVEPFTMPPEEMWTHIVPTLRFVRDHVEPAIGEVTVASAYRDQAFNECVRGASRSMHRGFHALDLVPRDLAVTREQLIAALCPLHAREGARFDIGMGIYSARRFHIDATRYRRWGADFHAASSPCGSTNSLDGAT